MSGNTSLTSLAIKGIRSSNGQHHEALQDGVTTSLWTNTGNTSFIEFTLESPQDVGAMEVNWADGDNIKYDFSIFVSPDQQNWYRVYGPINSSAADQVYTLGQSPNANPTAFVKIEIGSNNGPNPQTVGIGEITLFAPTKGQAPPPPPPPPSGAIWTSVLWANGKSRDGVKDGKPNQKFGWQDPYDPATQYSHAGASRKYTIDGKGSLTISGDRARVYILAKHYNAELTLTLIPNFSSSGDDCSLKLRSRHNEGGAPANRFGGMGWAVEKAGWDSKREDYHNVHTSLSKGKLAKSLVNGKEYKLKFVLKELTITASIDYNDGQGFVQVTDITDKKPIKSETDKASFAQESYFWIRNNGGGSITVKDVAIKALP